MSIESTHLHYYKQPVWGLILSCQLTHARTISQFSCRRLHVWFWNILNDRGDNVFIESYIVCDDQPTVGPYIVSNHRVCLHVKFQRNPPLSNERAVTRGRRSTLRSNKSRTPTCAPSKRNHWRGNAVGSSHRTTVTNEITASKQCYHVLGSS